MEPEELAAEEELMRMIAERTRDEAAMNKLYAKRA